MKVDECLEQRPLADLVDYAIGELEGDRQDTFERHLFDCGACSRRLESVFAMGAAIVASVADGPTAAAVSSALIDAMGARGTKVREYRIDAGSTVACTIAPDERFVAVRLNGMPEGVDEIALDIDFHDRSGGPGRVQHLEGLPVDAPSRAAVMLFPGALVRTYPRSRWTMTATGRRGDEVVAFGPFTMEHTPWGEL